MVNLSGSAIKDLTVDAFDVRLLHKVPITFTRLDTVRDL